MVHRIANPIGCMSYPMSARTVPAWILVDSIKGVNDYLTSSWSHRYVWARGLSFRISPRKLQIMLLLPCEPCTCIRHDWCQWMTLRTSTKMHKIFATLSRFLSLNKTYKDNSHTHKQKKKVCNQQHPLLALHILTPECTASTNLSRVEASGWRGNGNRPFVLSSFSCLLVDLFCIAYRSFYTPLTRIFGEKQHISLIYACYDSFK